VWRRLLRDASDSARGKNCLVEKLISDRIIGKDAIKSTLIRGWKPGGTSVFKL